MSAVHTTTAKNESMELCKLLASFFVVLIHVKFPGAFGEAMTSLARFGVPFFFAVSGYFSFRADTGKLAKRIRHIAWLNVTASIVCILCGMAAAKWQGWLPDYVSGLMPDWKDLAEWLLLSVNPWEGHLWYLSAILSCYVALYLYTGFFGKDSVNYRPLYITGISLFAVHFALGELAPATGNYIHYQIYRNAWFFGIPMFALGIFLREHEKRLLVNFRLTAPKLLYLLCIGVALSLIQWKGVGTGEMPLGALIQIIALILLTASRPRLTKPGSRAQRWMAGFGNLATTVYVIHLAAEKFYEIFLAAAVDAASGGREDWLRPIAVFLMALVIAVLWQQLRAVLVKLRTK